MVKLMDLYVFRAASTSRAVLAFCELASIQVNVKDVDISRGEHHSAAFAALNPSRLVPVLDDGGFVLTQASAILRYLASKAPTSLYPTEPRTRARIDEVIAWFEADFNKDFGFQYVYPQLFPHHARGTAEATRQTVDWGRDKSRAWLSVLESHFLSGGKDFLVGDTLTIADLVGVAVISLGELVGCTFADYANVRRWYVNVSSQPAWQKINRPFEGFAASIEKQSFVRLS
jgi:glutathione S-transferase